MSVGVVGRKRGMTRVFQEDGRSVPVTVVEVEANRVVQIKTVETDGYVAVQVTAGVRRRSRIASPQAGHFARAAVAAGRNLWELRAEGEDLPAVGDELPLDQFTPGQMVDVTGTSKGRGFTGVVRRWNFRTQDMTHGNSLSHRAPGSIGQCQTPGRVFKGKKMAGHMGAARVTQQNLEVVRVDTDRGVLLIRGAVPGPAGGDVVVRPAVKTRSAG